MRPLLIGALLGLSLAGCEGKQAPAPVGSAAPSAPAASASAPVETYGVQVGLPGDPTKVVQALNPTHEKPYSGPKGTLKGRIRIEGDPSPDTGLKFSPKCKDAQATYAKVFRVGLDNALADAMVTVTGYKGFIPASGPAAKATIHGCAANKRTIVATYGQRVEVANLDKLDSYVPYLDGAPSRAGMVAVPGGEAVKLYPPQAGHYMLRDTMPSGLVADVFVLMYPTHDVTGLDGQYEIKDVPVGKVRVDVFLPVIGKSSGQEFEIKEGENKLDVTLKFDAKKDMPGTAPSASASAQAPGLPPA
ncbi:Hypothetical protein A7982_04839 [Minicystis rosea]|nr:Hypothetical protein A7982_04839 [Minicystis rosea]